MSYEIVSRILQKVEKTETCWVWNGSKNKGKNSYGYIWFNRKNTLVHRIMYQIHKGDIPDGKEIDHLCRNKGCVNPDHLEAVSHRENMLRANVGWKCREKTHCPKGHEYTPENTRITHGSRSCKACESPYNKRRWAQSKANAAIAKVKEQK